jgi:hypothetical protein
MSEPKAGQLYRVRKSTGQFPEVITSKELMEGLYPEVPSARPDSAACPTGEWYCHNEDCVVREVRVSAKYLGGRPPSKPPAMNCPACGERMGFHHYLRSLALVPYAPTQLTELTK